ncbi:hypothetical protein EUGRSUZ_C04054 [Eucalyptus grandis]|uniref:Uncharacterized protein n=2 Tax=Eucalyptus grandis TaxID=71139 RepID=A0ACC3LL84_EUCGR|nr:hypothetical protein EUGRSUZ_C04054 [Eucalyptus grandis]
MSNASISDEVPYWLSNVLSDIEELNLSGNMLRGKFSQIIGKKMPLLMLMSLSRNNLSGGIPNSLCMSDFLSVLDLSKNQLSGKLPQCWRKSQADLHWILLGDNRLNGQIPNSLCYLEGLELLSLHGNGLNGVIPKCLLKLNFEILDLSDNQFTGRTLEFTKTLLYLFSIDLSSNALDGQIPEGLTRLARLQNLNLSQNKLVGKIPSDIGKLRDLESLDLSNNKLSGEIPPSISNLDFLSCLNLSYNNLSGPIPSGNQLRTLEDQSIYRGNNGLCGAPVLKVCPGDEHNNMDRPYGHNTSEDESNEGNFVLNWFYSGLGWGFAMALMGFCGILHVNQSWRTSYFQRVDRIIQKNLLLRMITMLWFRRAFQFQLCN